MKTAKKIQLNSSTIAEAFDAIRESQRGENLFECPVTGEIFPRKEGRLIEASGLGRMVEEGYAHVDGAEMPHNLVWTQMSDRLALGPVDWKRGERKLLSEEGAGQLLCAYGRIRGWLILAAELPAVRRVIQTSQSAKGVNSLHTTVDLAKLIAKYPSPKSLERKLWAVRRRAGDFLPAPRSGEAWEGTVSWAAIAAGLLSNGKVGKAALVAVYIHLSKDKCQASYRDARDWVIAFTRGLPLVTDDPYQPGWSVLCTLTKSRNSYFWTRESILVQGGAPRKLINL